MTSVPDAAAETQAQVSGTNALFPRQPGSQSAQGVIANNLSEELVREFYDPADRYRKEPLAAFLGRIISDRQVPPDVQMPYRDPYELLLVEATHGMLDGGEGIALPIRAERQTQLITETVRYAGNVALSVLEVVDEITAAHDRRYPHVQAGEFNSLPSRLVMSGKVLAMVAHENALRRNGREYYTHPDEVATIISLAWARQLGNRRQQERDTFLFLSYAHDGYEDTTDPFGIYLNRPVIVTPLVAKRVLELQDQPDAEETARALLFLTRTKAPDGSKMAYPAHIDRGNSRGGPKFGLPKAGDNQHNLNIDREEILPGDTKSAEKYARRHEYENSMIRTKQLMGQYGELALVTHTIFAVTREEVKRESKHTYPFDIHHVADAVLTKVLDRQAA